MAINASARARRAAGVLGLAILSALPYAMVYGIDRVLEVPNAAKAALWPTAVVPVLVAAVVAVQLLGARRTQRLHPVVVRPLVETQARELTV